MSGIAKNKTYSVLFIGNSYTYFSDLPNGIFQPIAEAAGYLVDVTSITWGGHKLAGHADPRDEQGEKVEKALTGSKKYDFVILQEQSLRPAIDPAAFYDAVRNLAARIRATGAQPILYCTWGRKTGSPELTEYGWTNEEMTWRLAAAYQAIGAELNIPVVYVGLAFFDVYTSHSEIDIYLDDMSHPSFIGSYLSAMTLFAGIFKADPTTVDYRGDVPAEQAEVLRLAAENAAFAPPAVPEQYRMTSEGVTALK